MRTHWIVLPATALILAGCGHKSRVDDVDLDNNRPLTAVTTPPPSAVPSATVTAEPVVVTTTTTPAPPVSTKPVVKAKPKPKPKKTTKEPEPEPEPEEVFYKNCTEVRDAGADPIRVGDPGYSRKLDRDGDGVACE